MTDTTVSKVNSDSDTVVPQEITLINLSPAGTKSTRRLQWSTLVRVLSPVALLLVWYLITRDGLLSPQVLPSPAQIVTTLVELYDNGALGDALQVSLGRAAIGLLIGASLGLLLGVAAGLFSLAEQVVDAPLQMFRMIPFIALTPLFLVWFGIGEEPKVALVAVATVFSVYLNTYGGVRAVDPKLIEAAQVFGARRAAVIFKLILPSALPTILLGLRYAMGVSLLALVAAEQINADAGIGYLVMVVGATSMRTDIIIAGIVVYALLGVAIDVVMRVLEYSLLPWKRARR